MNNCFDCSKLATAGQKLASMTKHAAKPEQDMANRLSQLVLITAQLFNQPIIQLIIQSIIQST